MANVGRFFHDFLIPVLVLVLGGVVAYDHVVSTSPGLALTPVVNGKTLGHKFAGSVAVSFGNSWLTAANILEQGKTVSEAQTALQLQWQTERVQAFASMVSPEFSKLLPEGTEPTTPSQRAEVVKLWRDFASGLKGGR